MAKTTIKGNLVLPEGVLYGGYLTYEDGKIISIRETSDDFQDVIDASNKYILPGAIDAHVHCYSALSEGFETATRAAAAGGVTTIVEMPYDADQLICTQQIFEKKKKLLEQVAVVDVAMLATIAPKDGLQEIPLLAESGACGFKISLFNTDSVRFPRIEEGELLDALPLIKQTGKPVTVHAETDTIVRKYIEKYKGQGQDNPIAHCLSRPKVAESTAALTILELAHETGAKVHLHHSTFGRIFELVEAFQESGTDATAETCTHYLVFSDADMENLGAKGKINPPLRNRNDVDDLWKLLSAGKIDMVTSDHAPWQIDKKQSRNIFDNSSGAPGVEVLLPILYSEGVAKGRISLLQLIKVLCENPANRFGMGHRKGKLAIGYDADIVVLNPSVEWEMDETAMQSNAGWSPYNGMRIHGKVEKTIVRGKEIYNGEVVGKKGDGIFIPAIHQ